MSAMPRESSFMPTIKCSSCGAQVEISMMGEHVCGESPAGPTPPASFDQFMPEKMARAMPPRVDTSAANRAFLGQGQLTPVSLSSGSRSVSPRTPNARLGAGGGDEYSPRIANDSPPAQQPRRPGGYGGFGGSDAYEADSLLPPASPKKQAPNLLQRMNTIAPGPFDTNRRPSNARQARDNIASRNDDLSERPRTGASNVDGDGSGAFKAAAPRIPRKNDYGGFGPPGQGKQEFEPSRFGMNNRADTFPRPNQPADLPARTPSAPGSRSDRRRGPFSDPASRPPLASERLRRPSNMQPRGSSRDETPGALPSVNLAAEFGVGNPYHTPSDSASSSLSGYQSAASSQPSSRSSPPRTADSSRTGRKPSDTSRFDDLMSDLQSSMEEFKTRDLLSPGLQSPRFVDRPFSPANRPPPPGERGYDPRIDPAYQNPSYPRSRSPLASPSEVTSFRDDPPPPQDSSRMDRSPPRSRPPPPSRFGSSPDRQFTPRSRSRSASRPREPPAMVPPSRGDCKSCGQPISGKSISSADGRLTGRYHKACFVCTTCRAPFASSTFYVLDDRPYCEQHYHELNGSLCGSCGTGIEGQYLEDESASKHHPGCFRCGDCNQVLRDGYFEVNGKAYCERDAWRRVQQPLPSASSAGGFGGSRKGSIGPSGLGLAMGLPSGPRAGGGVGLPNSRLGPRPRMEKRMTRLGIM